MKSPLTIDTFVSHLNIPELDVVLTENCGLLPDYILNQSDEIRTIGDIHRRSHLDLDELLSRLIVASQLSEGIGMTQDRLTEFASDHQNLILQCDISPDSRLAMAENFISTAERDWSEVYRRVRAANRILCICADGKRSFSTALGLREMGHKQAHYLRSTFLSHDMAVFDIRD